MEPASPAPFTVESAESVSSANLKRGHSGEVETSVLKGGGVKRAKVAPQSSDLALAKKMHGYMMQLRSSVDLGVKLERGTFGCALKKCKNIWSGSTPFAPSVEKELESRHPDFAEEFFQRFKSHNDLTPIFNVLKSME